jgi:hypothetical protein
VTNPDEPTPDQQQGNEPESGHNTNAELAEPKAASLLKNVRLAARVPEKLLSRVRRHG